MLALVGINTRPNNDKKKNPLGIIKNAKFEAEGVMVDLINSLIASLNG